MKLSEVLENYLVLTVGSVVGYTLPQEEGKQINIFFNAFGREHDQYFLDQEVLVDDPELPGTFVITDVDGQLCQFTAFAEAPLKNHNS